MKDKNLTKEEIVSVIEGKGCAHRIPVMLHFWTHPEVFIGQEERYRNLLLEYPNDIQNIAVNIPAVFDAPKNEPSYRWMNIDNPFPPGTALDAVCAIDDWDKLDDVLADFPDPNSPHLFSNTIPEKDGRYRLAGWWYWMFERFWSFRGMENALCDFYEYPDEVHRLFRALTDFYKVVATRCRNELQVDGIFISDDIGTQNSPFFSTELFREFFKPYYAELIEHCHSCGMHFWLHTCGNILPFIPEFIEIGLDVLHPIQKYTMNEVEVAAKYGDKICIWAGFDVQQIIPYGTAEDVRKEVRFMIDTYTRPDGRFMLTAGNNLTEDTKYESLKALLNEAVLYGKTKVESIK